MNIAEFKAEAEKLARVGYLLRKTGSGEPAAYWHGIGQGKLCICFNDGPRWLNVRLSEEAGEVSASDEPLRSPVPLYAQRYISLPPIDAVFQLGSERVESYLVEQDWPRDEPFNSNFPGETAHEYNGLWMGNCPMYLNDIAAVLGGWNMPWPDGDFEDLLGSELLLWTFEDAEPWVEVFRKETKYSVFQRIT